MLKLNAYVTHDNTGTAEIEFCETMVLQVLHPRFVKDRKDSVIANVIAVINIGYAYRYVGGKMELLRQFDLYSLHGRA